jgi:hypothetical protein
MDLGRFYDPDSEEVWCGQDGSLTRAEVESLANVALRRDITDENVKLQNLLFLRHLVRLNILTEFPQPTE